jgi:hypothetical protein
MRTTERAALLQQLAGWIGRPWERGLAGGWEEGACV